MSANITAGRLVIIDPDKPNPKVLVNGVAVEGVKSIQIVNNAKHQKVIIKTRNAPAVSALQAAGVTVQQGD